MTPWRPMIPWLPTFLTTPIYRDSRHPSRGYMIPTGTLFPEKTVTPGGGRCRECPRWIKTWKITQTIIYQLERGKICDMKNKWRMGSDGCSKITYNVRFCIFWILVIRMMQNTHPRIRWCAENRSYTLATGNYEQNFGSPTTCYQRSNAEQRNNMFLK